MKCTCSSKHKIEITQTGLDEKTRQHPCFSSDAHRQYGRMHLPVAPACNITCNYCNRRYDCNNESRPGVTSQILNPVTACQQYLAVRRRFENIKVAGIAGPGDALANWDATRTTIELIKQNMPDTIFCLSTNGLMLPELADELVELGVGYITVTVNCLDTAVGERIYKQVCFHGVCYEGAAGSRLLIDNQLQGIAALTSRGVVVKVNTVMIPGINEEQIPLIVRTVRDRGAYISNIMPLIPASGSAFENLPRTDRQELNRVRQICQADLRQMYHCKQCRADAVGMLGKDFTGERLAETGCSVESIQKAV